MPVSRLAAFLAGFVATGCQSYSPDPVDLEAHAKRFAQRVPDAASIRAFAAGLHPRDSAQHASGIPPAYDLEDGLDLREGHVVTLLFNPELQTLRLRAGVAQASAENAGRWADPVLSADFAKILQSVDHPWLAGGSIGLTLPLNGRLGLERELAQGHHAQALADARVAEVRALDALDGSWARWSASRIELELLEDLVQRLTDLESIATRLAAAQVMNQVEARAFTLERISRQAQLVRARAATAAAELELKQGLGLPPDRTVKFLPTMAIPERVSDPAARRAQLTHSPTVALAQREHDVSERQLALAVRKQGPDLTVLPGFQEEDAQPRAALGFSLPIPLWNGNAREIAQARAARAAAASALRGELERATQALARAEVRHAAAVDQRRLVDTQLVPLAEQQVADVRRLADLGQLDTLLILDTLTRSYQAKAAAVDAALAEAVATIEINALFWPTLGEGAETTR